MSCRNIILIFVAALLSVGGCERRAAPENVEIFDPNLDGPLTSITVDADPDILADQKKISAQIAKQRELELEEGGGAFIPPPSVIEKTSRAPSRKLSKQPAEAKPPTTQPAKKASDSKHDPRRSYKSPMRRLLDKAKKL